MDWEKNILLDKLSYFSEAYSHNKSKTKVELDFSNYATKPDLKGPTGIETSKVAKKADLANLTSDVEDLDIHKKVLLI